MLYRILLFMLLVSSVSTAQHHRCGTVPDEFMIQRLIQNKIAASEAVNRGQNQLHVPLKFHLVGMDDGSERISISQVFEQVCELNDIYSGFDMQFYLRDDAFNFINNSSAFMNGSGASSLFSSNADINAVNVFIVREATDGGGGLVTLAFYDPARDYIVSRKDMVEALVANVMPHEIGHYFSLLHTFNGWENDPYDAAKHGNPVNITTAPDMTTPVELVDKSNCEVGGDFLCDTEPDYNFGITLTSCDMPVTVSDPNGDAITVAKENYMTYFFNCGQYNFTPEQIAAIRADYNSPERSDIRDGSFVPSSGSIGGIPSMFIPMNGDVETFYNAVSFDWSDVSGSDRYFLEIAQNTSFTNPDIATFTDESGFLATTLSPNTQYFWRVKAVNDLNYCAPYGPLRSFTTGGDITSVDGDLKAESIVLYPNPARAGEVVTVKLNGLTDAAIIDIINIDGTPVIHKEFVSNGFDDQIRLNQSGLSPGVYFIQISTEHQFAVKKLMVNQ